MDTPGFVDYLGDPQADGDAREGQGGGQVRLEQQGHPGDHGVKGSGHRFVEVLAEAEGDFPAGRGGVDRAQRRIGHQAEPDLRRHAALDGRPADLAVTLGRVCDRHRRGASTPAR